VLEPIDEGMALRVQADESLKKPFEATALIDAVRRLVEESESARKESTVSATGAVAAAGPSAPPVPFVAVVDAEEIRAAVVLALDASMDAMAGEISRRVMATLLTKKPEPKPVEVAPPKPAPAPERIEPVRRISPLRIRSSILGLEAGPPDSE